jgi:hypothetical protein
MLMLPSRTPYDVELLIESLDWYAAREREVGLEIDHHHWRVHSRSEGNESCAQCQRGRATLTFVNGSRVPVCASCARAAVSARFAHWPRPDPQRLANAD